MALRKEQAPHSSNTPPRRAFERLRAPSFKRREQLTGYAFVAPQLLGVILVSVLPILQVIWLSFNSVNAFTGASTFAGLDNYERMVNDEALLGVLGTTAIYVAGLTVLGVALAVFLAVLVNKRLRGINIFRGIFFVPALVTLAAWTLSWNLALQPGGIVEGFFASVGVDAPNWLNEPGWALATVIVLQGLKNVGINMMVVLAALQAVPAELEEAARLDGAGSTRIFWRITLPTISPSVFMVAILMLVGSFKAFEQVYLLTGGGPGRSTTVLSYYIYVRAFVESDIGFASALATLLFVIVMILTAVFWAARRKFVHYEE